MAPDVAGGVGQWSHGTELRSSTLVCLRLHLPSFEIFVIKFAVVVVKLWYLALALLHRCLLTVFIFKLFKINDYRRHASSGAHIPTPPQKSGSTPITPQQKQYLELSATNSACNNLNTLLTDTNLAAWVVMLQWAILIKSIMSFEFCIIETESMTLNFDYS